VNDTTKVCLFECKTNSTYVHSFTWSKNVAFVKLLALFLNVTTVQMDYGNAVYFFYHATHLQRVCIAWCMRWPCSVSVRLSVTVRCCLVYQNGWMDWAGFWHRGFDQSSTLYCEATLVSSKISVLPCELDPYLLLWILQSFSFFSRDAMLVHLWLLAVGLCMCVCVCPFVTSQYSIKTSAWIELIFVLHASSTFPTLF